MTLETRNGTKMFCVWFGGSSSVRVCRSLMRCVACRGLLGPNFVSHQFSFASGDESKMEVLVRSGCAQDRGVIACSCKVVFTAFHVAGYWHSEFKAKECALQVCSYDFYEYDGNVIVVDQT